MVNFNPNKTHTYTCCSLNVLCFVYCIKRHDCRYMIHATANAYM